MKVTKQRLIRIIKEEIQKEVEDLGAPYKQPVIPDRLGASIPQKEKPVYDWASDTVIQEVKNAIQRALPIGNDMSNEERWKKQEDLMKNGKISWTEYEKNSHVVKGHYEMKFSDIQEWLDGPGKGKLEHKQRGVVKTAMDYIYFANSYPYQTKINKN